MAGQQGMSATNDQMPKRDNFFAQLDKEDSDTGQAEIIEHNISQSPKMGAEIIQEAERLEKKLAVKPPDVVEKATGDKSGNSELLEAMKAQTENINALIESKSSQPVAQPKAEQPKNLAEYLFGKEGAENFVYDPEEAISDPSSDSAKYHKAEIALETRRQIDRAKAEDKENDAQAIFEGEKKALMEEFKMSDSDFAKFEKEAEARSVTLKDIYLMLHRDEISENIAKNTVNQFSSQRTRMSEIAPAFASKGGQEIQKETDSQFFGNLFNIKDNEFETTI